MRLYVLTAAILLGLSACDKTNNNNCDTVGITAPFSEVSTLRDYIRSNGISATEDSRGFFYLINNNGNDNRPTPCSNLVVNYQGQLTDGTPFDQGSNVSFNLANLIPGWQEGLPLIGEGGSITLYLTPSLGYGQNASGKIPPNSITIFSIELISVQ